MIIAGIDDQSVRPGPALSTHLKAEYYRLQELYHPLRHAAGVMAYSAFQATAMPTAHGKAYHDCDHNLA